MRWRGAAVALVVSLVCREAAAQPAPIVAPVTSRHPRWGLLFSGIGVLATGQAISILVGAMDGFRDAAGWTLVPIAGPWIAGGAAMSDPRGCLVKGPDCGAFAAAPTLIAAGVIQVVGAALITLGVVFPRTTTTRAALGPHGIAVTF